MEKIIDGKKKCSKCKVVKEVSCFGANKQIKSGLSPDCKKCFNERYRLARILKIEQIRVKARAYRENNLEKIRNYNAEYREKLRAKQKKRWHEHNPNAGTFKPVRDIKGRFSKQIKT